MFACGVWRCRSSSTQATLKASPLRDFVAATSVGIVDGEILLDLCYEEDCAPIRDMNFVMTGAGKLVEVQATAEQNPYEEQQLLKMIAMARKGVEGLIVQQRANFEGLAGTPVKDLT